MNATQEEIQMTASEITSNAMELDARAGDGIDVRLFWLPSTDTVSVSLLDKTQQQSFELVVDPTEALDAFNHPFAYAAFRGSPFATPLRAHDEALGAA